MFRQGLMVFLLSGKGIFCLAQFHPILDNFFAYRDNDNIVLRWTITSGSTCNGIKIFRAEDTLAFSQIGVIAGVCGSSSSSVDYDFTDENPIPNRVNYYRLELGTQGFSKYISVEFIVTGPNGFLIKPHPVSDFSVVYFDNDLKLSYDFSLTDVSGKQVMSITNISSDFFTFYKSSLRPGIYIFTLTHNGIARIKAMMLIQ